MTATSAPVRRRFRLGVVLGSVAVAIVGSILLITHDSAAKVTTSGVSATIHTPARPGWVAASEDALWVAVADPGTTAHNRPLLRLNPASGALEQPIFLGGRATYLAHVGERLLASVEYRGGSGSGPSLIVALDWRTGRLNARSQLPKLVGPLAESGKDLWALQVEPAALLRLDPLTLTPTESPIRLSGGRALGLAAADGHVWVTEPDVGDVVRVDGATRSVTRAHVGGSPAGIAVAAGAVWFADRDGGEVRRLDPRTLRPVGKPTRVGGKPSWLATAGRYLFAADPVRGTLTKVDLRSGKTAGPPIRVAPPASAAPALLVASAGSSVWVSSFASSTLTRVGAPSAGGRVVASVKVPDGGAFTVGEGAVWVMSDATSTLLRIDPTRNAVVARIHVSHVTPGGAAAAGNGAVWLSHPQENTVSRIDPTTNTVSATIRIPEDPQGVAVTPGAVWVASVLGPSVRRIDPTTNRVVATIRVGPNRECCAEHMGLTAGNGSVWATLANGNRLVRIDARTNKVAAGIELGRFLPCGELAADRSAVWVAGATCTGAVARIDPRAKRVTTELPEPHAVGMALASGSVWVAVFDTGDVDRIDPRSGQVVARLHVGGWPVRLAVGFGSVWVNDDKGRVLRIQP